MCRAGKFKEQFKTPQLREKFGCPNLLRVYSKSIELQDFPEPNQWDLSEIESESPIVDQHKANDATEYKDITLHHVIRDGDNKFGFGKHSTEIKAAYERMSQHYKNFKAMETKISKQGSKSSYSDKLLQRLERQEKRLDEATKVYQQIVLDAKKEAVRMADLLICTLVTTATLLSWGLNEKESNTVDGSESCVSSDSDEEEEECILHHSDVNQVIIDECGMATEPQTLIPIVCMRPMQVVLIGDHKQLRPVVMSKLAVNYGLNISLFERYCEHRYGGPTLRERLNIPFTMLDQQYRMHPAICHFPSMHFYNGELISNRHATSDENRKPLLFLPARDGGVYPYGKTPDDVLKKRLVFLRVNDGKEVTRIISAEEGSVGSRWNVAEATEVVRIYNALKTYCGVLDQDMVVVSQYKAQVAKLKQLLRDQISQNIKKRTKQKKPNSPDFKDLHVRTSVQCQGSEFDITILSTVRTLEEDQIPEIPMGGWFRHHLGSIEDPNLLNVSLTRAKRLLLIIGDDKLLRKSRVWASLLDYCENQGYIMDAKDFLSQ